MSRQVEIRRAESDGDFAGYARVWNAITPREPITVGETRRRLEAQPWRLYLVAEQDGRIVGCGSAGRSDSVGRAFFSVRVLTDCRRQGIGLALLERVQLHAADLDATIVQGRVAADDEDSLNWVLKRGFVEVGRDVELVRQLGEEPPAVPPEGIEIKELTPADHDAVYAIAVECWPDMPMPEPIPAPPYDDWAQEELRGPSSSAPSTATVWSATPRSSHGPQSRKCSSTASPPSSAAIAAGVSPPR